MPEFEYRPVAIHPWNTLWIHPCRLGSAIHGSAQFQRWIAAGLV